MPFAALHNRPLLQLRTQIMQALLIFLMCMMGDHGPAANQKPFAIRCLPNHALNLLFSTAAEAVEEAIFNVLSAAETMNGGTRAIWPRHCR